MFDTTREVLFEGTVVRFDWVNPHMYLIIETRGSDGTPLRVEGEGLATTQARADSLKREALKPGMRVDVTTPTARFIPSTRRVPASAR